MNWKDRIVTGSSVFAGKPAVKGTCFSVRFLLNLKEQIGCCADGELGSGVSSLADWVRIQIPDLVNFKKALILLNLSAVAFFLSPEHNVIVSLTKSQTKDLI